MKKKNIAIQTKIKQGIERQSGNVVNKRERKEKGRELEGGAEILGKG